MLAQKIKIMHACVFQLILFKKSMYARMKQGKHGTSFYTEVINWN